MGRESPRQLKKALHATHSDLEHALRPLVPGLELVALSALGDRDQAQDAAQEVCVRVLEAVARKGLPAGYTLDTYAFGILKHVISDVLRARKRRYTLPSILRAPGATPLEELVSAERSAIVSRALSQLERTDRELLERCYWRDEKVAEIARATGERADRIRKRKSRALERLRSLLGKDPGHTSLSSDD